MSSLTNYKPHYSNINASTRRRSLICAALLVPAASTRRSMPGQADFSWLSLSSDADEAVCDRDFKHPEWLKDCTAIYLDIGSNKGVQIRKLYEPEKYSGKDKDGKTALVLPIFDKAFGQAEVRKAKDSGICALGFEPNPFHRTRLTKIEAAYNAKGWRTHFYPVAVWDERGSMKFNVTDDPTHADWGANLISSLFQSEVAGWHQEDVCTINMGDFIQSLPKGSVKLGKMDIEGAEWRVIPAMLEKQQFCSDVVGEIFIEAHGWGNNSKWTGEQNYASARKVIADRSKCEPATPSVFIEVDDESFLLDVDGEYEPPVKASETSPPAKSSATRIAVVAGGFFMSISRALSSFF